MGSGRLGIFRVGPEFPEQPQHLQPVPARRGWRHAARVNRPGTQGFGGGIDGSTVVYQEVTRTASRLVLYDTAAHSYTGMPITASSAAAISDDLRRLGPVHGWGAPPGDQRSPLQPGDQRDPSARVVSRSRTVRLFRTGSRRVGGLGKGFAACAGRLSDESHDQENPQDRTARAESSSNTTRSDANRNRLFRAQQTMRESLSDAEHARRGESAGQATPGRWPTRTGHPAERTGRRLHVRRAAGCWHQGAVQPLQLAPRGRRVTRTLALTVSA